LSPPSKLTVSAKYDVQATAAPSSFYNVNCVMQCCGGFIELGLADVGERQISQDDGL
jgi:hypothetical protein